MNLVSKCFDDSQVLENSETEFEVDDLTMLPIVTSKSFMFKKRYKGSYKTLKDLFQNLVKDPVGSFTNILPGSCEDPKQDPARFFTREGLKRDSAKKSNNQGNKKSLMEP